MDSPTDPTWGALTLNTLRSELKRRLTEGADPADASATVDFIFESLKGWNKTDLTLRGEATVSDFVARKAREAVEQVIKGCPVQYIFSRAHFYGMELKVTPATLIPRPETAMLVDMIVDRCGHRRDLRVLDLGTGSGCIAIALSRNLPFATVTGVDISRAALDIAKENADALHASIELRQADMLTDNFDGEWDVIVSNPPYVLQSESADMEPNVLNYEPHSALFVPDDDPLKFYRAIARIASRTLARDGLLCLEINPLCASALEQLLKSEGFTDISVSRDLENRLRFIIASR